MADDSVPPEAVVTDAATLMARARRILLAMGTTEAAAEEVARHLVQAELSGHASHGLLRLPQYSDEIKKGLIHAAAAPTFLSQTNGAIVMDARHCFGHFAAAVATDAVGTLTLLGGALAGHKGYGFALTAALLGGLAHADGSAPSLSGLSKLREPDGAVDSLGGITIFAINPGAFGVAESYAAATGRVSRALREDGVLIPGDVERQCRENSMVHGLAIPGSTLAALNELEKELSILPGALTGLPG